MVTDERYDALYQAYDSVSNLAAVLGALTIIVLVLWLVFVGLYAEERSRRQTLQAELNRRGDPEQELKVIQALGDTGRQEMWRATAEARRALAALTGE